MLEEKDIDYFPLFTLWSWNSMFWASFHIMCHSVTFYLTFFFLLFIQVLSFISERRKEDKSLDIFLSRPLVSWTMKIFFRIYTLVVFGYCLIPFLLLTYVKWWDVLKQLYFFGHVIYIPAVILTPILLQQFKPRVKKTWFES